MSFKRFFYFKFGGHLIQQKETIFAILIEGHPILVEGHSCEFILKSGQWPMRRYCLKVFYIFSPGSHFVQLSGTILAILVEGHPGNISVKLF